ncbi:MAG: hypothetical protein JJU20_09650 [Opitutales bacterium]|nr:hypothetical protein [Opitutales bacterium]
MTRAKELPPQWPGAYEDLIKEWQGLERAQVRQLTLSAGGRPVFALHYGEKEMVSPSANFNAAVASKQASAFPYRYKRQRPSVLLLAVIHGGEHEGLFGLQSLMKLLETNTDLYGREWPELVELAQRCRLSLVPVVNPDGYVRFTPGSGKLLSETENARFVTGSFPDGSIPIWPTNKAVHPFPKGGKGFLGAYYNDNGINIQHDEFFRPMADETKAILDLVYDEWPNATMHFHTCPHGSCFFDADYTPIEHFNFASETAQAFSQRMQARGIPDGPLPERNYPSEAAGKPFNLISAVYHATGSYSLLFETELGSDFCQHELSFEEIHDTQLIAVSAFLKTTLENFEERKRAEA